MSGMQYISEPGSLQFKHHASRPRLDVGASWIRGLLWLTFAVSSIVFIEPSPFDVLTITMFCVLFVLGLRSSRGVALGVFLLALFLVGNLVGALAAGFTSDAVRSLSIRIYLSMSWLLFASLIAANPIGSMKTIWSGYAVAAIIVSCYGIGQYYGLLPGDNGQRVFRAAGSFKDANVFGPFLVPMALYFSAKLINARPLSFLLNGVCFLLLLVAILLSFSRGAWLNLATSFGLFALLLVSGMPSYRQQMKMFLVVLVLSLLGTLSLTWVVTKTTAGQMFAERATFVQQYDVAVNGRFAAQSGAVELVGTNPVGVGPGMANDVLGGVAPHNIYLHVALEGGWLGVISFLAFAALSLWRGLIGARHADPPTRLYLQITFAATVGVLVQSFFIDSTHWRHLWVLFAVLWGLTASGHGSTGKSWSR